MGFETLSIRVGMLAAIAPAGATAQQNVECVTPRGTRGDAHDRSRGHVRRRKVQSFRCARACRLANIGGERAADLANSVQSSVSRSSAAARTREATVAVRAPAPDVDMFHAGPRLCLSAEPNSTREDGVDDVCQGLAVHPGTFSHHRERLAECTVRLERHHALRLGHLMSLAQVPTPVTHRYSSPWHQWSTSRRSGNRAEGL